MNEDQFAGPYSLSSSSIPLFHYQCSSGNAYFLKEVYCRNDLIAQKLLLIFRIFNLEIKVHIIHGWWKTINFQNTLQKCPISVMTIWLKIARWLSGSKIAPLFGVIYLLTFLLRTFEFFKFSLFSARTLFVVNTWS